MYATFTHTRQWVSHHHLLLGALLTLLALAVILLVRALIPFAPAPAQPAVSETDVSLVMVPGVRDQYYTEKNVPLGVAARLRYEDMKQRQWEQRDAALDAVSVVPVSPARLRYEDMKQRQWEQRDAAPDAVSVAPH